MREQQEAANANRARLRMLHQNPGVDDSYQLPRGQQELSTPAPAVAEDDYPGLTPPATARLLLPRAGI